MNFRIDTVSGGAEMKKNYGREKYQVIAGMYKSKMKQITQ